MTVRDALRPIYRRLAGLPPAPEEAPSPDPELLAFLCREGYLEGYAASPDQVQILVRIKDESKSGEPVRAGGYNRSALQMKDHELLFTVRALCTHVQAGGRVMDVASGSSTLPALYASMGFQAVHHDVHPLAYDDPPVEDVTCDVLELAERVPAESLDAVTVICAMEHFGLGRYGDAIDGRGDFRAVEQLRRVLRPGGHLVVTVPFGPPAIVFNTHRVYDHHRLTGVLEGFEVVEEEYRVHPDWRRIGREEAEAVQLNRSVKRPGKNYALALWVARKK